MSVKLTCLTPLRLSVSTLFPGILQEYEMSIRNYQEIPHCRNIHMLYDERLSISCSAVAFHTHNYINERVALFITEQNHSSIQLYLLKSSLPSYINEQVALFLVLLCTDKYSLNNKLTQRN